jgi:hypothetical protein
MQTIERKPGGGGQGSTLDLELYPEAGRGSINSVLKAEKRVSYQGIA